MSAPSMRRHPSARALWPTLTTTWVAFAQVLSFQGLAIWVATGCLLTALAVLPLALAGRRVLAVAAALAVTLAVPALAETLGGNTAGPVTRASLMACAVTAAMCVILPTQYPVAIVPASAMLLLGALGLGATGSVLWLVGLWAVAAAVTIAMVGPYRQSDLSERSRLVPFAGLLLAAGAIAVITVIVVAPVLRDPWTIPGSGTYAVPEAVAPSPGVPPATDAPDTPDSTTSDAIEAEPLPSADAVAPPDATPVPAEDSSTVVGWLARVLALLLLLLLLGLVALLAWRGFVAWRWDRTRRRLATGPPAQQVVGAWTWVRLRRAHHERPLPVSLSPDVAVAWSDANAQPDVHAVARVVAAVAFNPAASVPPAEADRAWEAARRAGRPAPGAGARARWRWSGRLPYRAYGTLTSPGGTSSSVG